MMENSPVCSEFKPHPFRKLCEGCRNPKIEHDVDDEKEHQVRLESLLGESPPTHQQGDENYTWVPTVQPPATVEKYFEALPEALVPKRGTAAEQVRRKAWRVQVPIQDVSMEHLRFLQPKLQSSFEDFMQHLREDSFDFGFVQMWTKELPIQCANCLTLIEEDELVVMSPKSALCVYHPTCFVCTGCNEHLVDLAHCFGTDGNVYCERHYAERHKKRCHTCDELLFCSRYAQSCDMFYHKDHLLCYNCDSDLAGSGAFEKHGELFCSQCYEKLYCHDCVKCQNRISIEDKHVSFKENHWHSDCFTCEICKESLTTGPFELHDGHYYCCKCFETHYAPKCDKCNEMFDPDSKVLKYQGATFHISCFKCGNCDETIGTGSFIPKNDLVYCKKCYVANFGIRCGKCHEPLSGGKGITYRKVPYHPRCFTCHGCSAEIGSKPFKSVEDCQYCMGCYGDLYCDKCHACGKAILLGAEHEVLFAYDGKKYHDDCFVCFKCHSSLADVPIAYHEKHLLCEKCSSGTEPKDTEYKHVTPADEVSTFKEVSEKSKEGGPVQSSELSAGQARSSVPDSQLTNQRQSGETDSSSQAAEVSSQAAEVSSQAAEVSSQAAEVSSDRAANSQPESAGASLDRSSSDPTIAHDHLDSDEFADTRSLPSSKLKEQSSNFKMSEKIATPLSYSESISSSSDDE